jgi:hypothetical protein
MYQTQYPIQLHEGDMTRPIVSLIEDVRAVHHACTPFLAFPCQEVEEALAGRNVHIGRKFVDHA